MRLRKQYGMKVPMHGSKSLTVCLRLKVRLSDDTPPFSFDVTSETLCCEARITTVKCVPIRLGESVLVVSRTWHCYTCSGKMPGVLALHLCLGLSNLFASLGKRGIRCEYERAADWI